MANKIGLITKWSTEMFDEAYVAGARSSVLDANKGLLSFTGAKTVRFPKWQGDGLYNYNRANEMVDGKYLGQSTSGMTGTKGYGYQQGDTNLVWEERTMRVDRAVQYRIDRADNEETQEKAVAFATGQINKQKIIPEIDAYCFSQIVYEACSDDLGNLVKSPVALTDTTIENKTYNPLSILDKATKFLEENEIEKGDIVGFVSTRFEYALRRSPEVTKFARPEDFGKAWNFLIDDYNGVKYVEVPPRRFYTHITLGAGSFYPSANSEIIDALLVDKSAVYHIVKYNTIKVFGPDVVQDYDGYKVNARIYHDVFVPDNKKVACYCVLANGEEGKTELDKLVSNKLAVNIAYKTKGANTSWSLDGITTVPGSLLYDKIVFDTATASVGDDKSTLPETATEIEMFETFKTSATATAVTGYFYILDKDGVVLAVTKQKTLPTA